MQLKVVLFAGILALAFYRQSPAQEVRYSEFGRILGLETGWKDDTMGVKLDEHQFVNSYEIVFTGDPPFFIRKKPCGDGKANYYVLDPQDPGVKLHEAVLLSAFLSGRKVRVLVQGCIYDEPKIIGVGIGAPIY